MRNIFEVDAIVVDANGTFNHMSGYPKRFDSNSYSEDIEGTMKRAKAEYYNTLGSMYGNQSNRQIQTVMLTTVKGKVILSDSIGDFPTPVTEYPVDEVPEPETEG